MKFYHVTIEKAMQTLAEAVRDEKEKEEANKGLEHPTLERMHAVRAEAIQAIIDELKEEEKELRFNAHAALLVELDADQAQFDINLAKAKAKSAARLNDEKLVHYFPQDAPGSAAWLTESEANEQMTKDMEYCANMQKSTGEKLKLPYIAIYSPITNRL